MTALPSSLFLAPMAEISTPALRRVVSEFGAKVTMFSEMLSAGALAAGGIHNEPMAARHDFDDPFIYQIVGNSPRVMAGACRILTARGCHGIDINMGCSAPAIVKRGFGAALLKAPGLAREIVRECRKAAAGTLSVKLRTGYQSNDRREIREFVRILEGEGVDFITVHPRYARLSFTRTADWDMVSFIRESVAIPVIGNGDITDPRTALRRMEETGCSGVMIGREAVKSPWIFLLCDMAQRGGGEVFVDVRGTFLKALGYIRHYLPERLRKSRGHRFSSYYTQNLKFGHSLFSVIRNTAHIDDMMAAVDGYFARNPGEARKTIVLEKEEIHALTEV